MMRKLGIALAVLVTLLVAGTIFYFMPRAAKVRVTDTEVARVDRKDPAGTDKTRDVRFIYATDVDTGKARVFRNEDFAWYLKFDSGDVAAEASKLATSAPDQVALVKYYGVRIPIFSLYPNVLSLKEVPEDYVHVPWVNMIVLILLLVGFVWAGMRVRRLFRGAKARFSKKPGEKQPEGPS